jgi:hypothetical protein
MINDEPDTETGAARDAEVETIVRSGSAGAIAVAGIATAVVIGIWFAFYILVFIPRAVAP